MRPVAAETARRLPNHGSLAWSLGQLAGLRLTKATWLTFVLIQLIVVGRDARAQDMVLPIKMQGLLLQKLIFYDVGLKAAGAESVVVALAYSAANSKALESAVAAFRAAGLKSLAVEVDKLAEAATATTVVYFVPGVDVASANAICAEKGLLSVAGSADLAERGEVTLAVSVGSNGRPLITVNLKRAKLERRELSAQLLAIARVIR